MPPDDQGGECQETQGARPSWSQVPLRAQLSASCAAGQATQWSPPAWGLGDCPWKLQAQHRERPPLVQVHARHWVEYAYAKNHLFI